MENVPDVQRGLWPRRWLPDERSATLACTSTSSVSVIGFVCRSVACYSTAVFCILLAVSEYEGDDELEAVTILRKTSPTTPDPTTLGRAYLPHVGDFVEQPPKPNSKTLVFCFFFNSG